MTICTATPISIRRATAGDVPQIADMMQLVSGRDHSVEAVRTMTAGFAPGRFYGWLAFAGNEPAGLTTLEPCILERTGTAIKAGYWRYLWVRPDQRRTKIYAPDLQRRLTPESFANRYYSNSDGAQYRVLTVGRSGAVSAALVYRIAV